MEPDGYRAGRPYPLVILMHGYGSNMSDLVPLVPMISRAGYLFAFPNAPIRMDFGLGMVGYAWSAPLEADFDEDGRAESLLDEPSWTTLPPGTASRRVGWSSVGSPRAA